MPNRIRRRSELHNVEQLRLKPVSPRPSDKLVHPWRFKVGEWVHVRGRELGGTQTFEVLGGELINSFPHYRLRAVDGSEWCVSQLRVGADPLENLR